MNDINNTPTLISDHAREAILDVLKQEGGYVDDNTDRGGETRYGISKKSYPHVDIAALTVERAIAIYHQDYWQKIHGDALPEALAEVVFDCAVNQGCYAAATILQSLVGAEQDGVIGPATLAKVDIFIIPVISLVHDFTDARILKYSRLVRDNPTQSKFIYGWVLRAINVRNRAISLETQP